MHNNTTRSVPELSKCSNSKTCWSRVYSVCTIVSACMHDDILFVMIINRNCRWGLLKLHILQKRSNRVCVTSQYLVSHGAIATELQGLTSRRGDPPFTTSRRFLLRTRDSAATAAAVLLVGTLLQSPSENILAVDTK